MDQRSQIRAIEIGRRKQIARPILALALNSQSTTFAFRCRHRITQFATFEFHLCIIFRTRLRCKFKHSHTAMSRHERTNLSTRSITHHTHDITTIAISANRLKCNTLRCTCDQIATLGHKIDIDRIIDIGQQNRRIKIAIRHFECHINLTHNAFDRSVFDTHLSIRIGAQGKRTVLLALASFGTLHATTLIWPVKPIKAHQSRCRTIFAQHIAHLVHYHIIN